jgi:N-acetylneuraminic acid mutarotase
MLALVAVIQLTTQGARAVGKHPSASRSLTLDERVAAQRAIEEVYWRHRIWPKDNLTAKPSLDAVMPEGAIRAKVEDYLKKSNALETLWRRPIAGEQLEAELDRMARGSRDMRVLQELFDALGNDPYVIAETLARPILVERLARNWYVNDDRFHGPTHRKAEQAIAKCRDVSCMKEMGGKYSETTATLLRDDGAIDPSGSSSTSLKLDTEQWKRLRDRMASIPERRLGKLQETNDAFVVTAVLSQRDGEIVTATTRWPKRSFDAWWNLERTRQPTTVASTAHEFTLPNLSTGCTNDTWTPTVTDVPDGREGHVAVWTGTEMIIWGGANTITGFRLNTGGRYNPATDSWTATSTGANVPFAAYLMTAVWTGTEMIVWGGDRFEPGNRYQNTGGRYDPANDSWRPTSTGIGVPSGRARHTAVWTGTEMIIWGGVWEDTVRITGGRYNPSTDTWIPTSVGANVPTTRTGHTAIWTGTEMIVWAGSVSGPVHLGNNGGRYNPSSDTWSPTSRGANVPSARHDHTAIWTGTEMIVWGGQNHEGSEFANTGGRYDPVTDSWITTSTGANVPAARSGHTAVWTGSTMIVWGGSSSGNWLSSGAVYDPANDSWAATSESILAGRFGYTAVWTGTEMIVWGGLSIGDPISNSGGRYNPTTDTWVATSRGGSVPQARTAHRSVWTGTEMIVWGGRIDYDLFSPTRLNSGGRYSPATDSWVPTSMGAGVPAPRDSHAVVWTGKEMIVWGGNGVTNSGGRYNALADSWVATSTGANVPSWRTHAMAVWTDSEMIVWGGFGYGGRYDPVTDSWRAMSTGADVPAAWSASTLVWTGSEMITWGFDGGGRYVPSKDVWTAISDGDGAPIMRFEFTSIWTGAEMIVWGGRGGGGRPVGPFGGRYNPRTDTWTPTSSGVSTASARFGHVANWTGSEMLVWGGASIEPDNGGGRYDPSTDTWEPILMDTNAPSFYEQTAVWTGTEMIVWGGEPITSTGARYCAVP